MSEPSPFTVTKNGLSYRIELDVHYISEAEMQMLRRYIANLNDENEKLRGLVRDYERCTMHADCAGCELDGKLSTHCPLSPCFPDIDELGELGVEVES